MQSNDVIAGIDVGTTKICTIVARKVNGQFPEVIAHSVVPCSGLKKGNVEGAALEQEENLKKQKLLQYGGSR